MDFRADSEFATRNSYHDSLCIEIVGTICTGGGHLVVVFLFTFA